MSLLIPGAAQKPKEDLSPSPGDFLTQGLNLGLLHGRWTLLPSESPGKPPTKIRHSLNKFFFFLESWH